MKNARHHFLIVIFIFPTFLYGQRDTLRYNSDAFRVADGILYTYSAPARWDGNDWLVLGGLLVGTTALSFIDEPVRSFWQGHDNRFLDGVERIGYHYGKAYTALGVTAGLYLSGMIFKSEWAKETGLMLGTSIFSNSLLMAILKNTAGRARPGPEMGNLAFSPFSNEPAFHAFPSGHSSVAFGISIVLARRVDVLPLKILFYSLAGTTVVSRMYSDSHWLSDIGFGGMLAWFCADIAIARMQTNRFRTVKVKARDRLVWSAHPYPGGLTLRASFR